MLGIIGRQTVDDFIERDPSRRFQKTQQMPLAGDLIVAGHTPLEYAPSTSKCNHSEGGTCTGGCSLFRRYFSTLPKRWRRRCLMRLAAGSGTTLADQIRPASWLAMPMSDAPSKLRSFSLPHGGEWRLHATCDGCMVLSLRSPEAMARRTVRRSVQTTSRTDQVCGAKPR